jgi:hypothetical protein
MGRDWRAWPIPVIIISALSHFDAALE